MGKILILIIIVIVYCILWALPLYLCGNLVLWLFHSTLRLTIFQSFGLCLLATVIHTLLFKDKEGK